MLPLSDLTDIARVVHSFHVLTCGNARIAELSSETLRVAVKKILGRAPDLLLLNKAKL